ncbi:MAG: DNA-binding protein WhiA [Lachnospiraceae bacterium]|jgi:hypothetical protein|nr:DNA-binding protein WhiA [Lachnospiraceae bacterium]
MSFSGNVKEELARNAGKARHCQMAELAGILSCIGKIECTDSFIRFLLETENVILAKRYYELVKNAFSIQPTIATRRNSYLSKNRLYVVDALEPRREAMMFMALKLTPEDIADRGFLVNELLLHKSCCKRAFIRGVFLAAGSVTDPEKGYHFEVVFRKEENAKQFIEQLAFFEIEGKTTERKGSIVVYIKEGAQIVDALNVMEAHSALMELENVRILKEVRNTVNRKVNCETANINKTVHAAVKQIEDIKFIRDHKGLESLPPALEAVARMRLQYPEAPLKELGSMLSPPVGKSGVNHRLKKISELAKELKDYGGKKDYEKTDDSSGNFSSEE